MLCWRVAACLLAGLLGSQFHSTAQAASITIDPGHSPRSPGAMSCSGKPEFMFNEALSEIVAARLRSDGLTVRLSKPRGDVSLDSRAKSSGGTEVLLSIHHDSVQPQFITKSKQSKGRCSNKASGFSLFVSGRNPHYEQSLDFARRLGQALVRRGFMPSLHHAEAIRGENRELEDKTLGIYRFDDLVVLKRSTTPALLLEAAVIVNPADESSASSDDFSSAIADSVREMLNIKR